MKVFIVRRNFWATASGGDQQAVNYATELRAAGHEPALVLTHGAEQNDEYTARLRQARIPIYSIHQQPHYHEIEERLEAGQLPHVDFPLPGGEEVADYWACRELFARERPDLVHVIDCWQTLLAIRAGHAEGIPVVYQDIRTPRDRPLIQPTTHDYHADMDYLYEELRWYLRMCAGAATLSVRLGTLFRERLGYQGPVYCMPLLVPEPFGVRPSARAASDVVTVGFAARLEVLKGPLVLLDAWSVLHARFPDAILKVAGAGEDEIAIRERAAALHLGPSCVFSGTYAGLEEKTAFLDSLDLFVLPSFTEGTPNSLIEAMAHGLPVVTTRVGGIPDVVTPNCGLLVPPGDVGALATALARLVADAVLRGRMGHAARKRYEARYTPAVVTPQLLEMYRVVLAAQIPSRDC